MQSNECTRNCWIAAGVMGLLVWIFASFIGETSVMGGLFLGLIAAGLLGLFLVWALCRGAGSVEDDQLHAFASSSATSTAAAFAPETKVAGVAPASATSAASTSSAPRAEEKAPAPASEKDQAASADGDSKAAAAAAPAAAAPSAASPVTGADAEPEAKAEDKKPSKDKKAKKDKKKPEAKAEKAAKGKSKAKAKDEKPAKAKAKDEKPAKAKDKPAKKAKAAAPDDLKQIKGVGPKLEKLLHDHGVTQFSQIAAWGEAEMDDFAEKIGSMGGRIRSDDWVSQAKTLAEGGETEFSQRVEKGDVY